MFRLHYFIFILSFICLLGGKQASATHIVGGDLTYKHLTGDSFEIQLILYVDCAFGSAQAIAADTNAMIGVFDTSGTRLFTLLEYRSAPVRINSVNYNCVSPPSNACVNKYVYTYYAVLPQRPGGYILAFQRCCRNNSITNIVTPGQVGATYWTAIPDTVQTFGFNSSAVFKSLPPNFLCAGRDFINDHSAYDADGDLLVYELYRPYLGASFSVSLPRPPSAPPYPLVNWETGFGVNNMMKGNPELTINSQTGLLTVKPQFIGQYVVGILVKEYRKGKLISTTRRDFQFNVLNCQFDVVSAFGKDIQSCSDTVRFVNQSTGATSYQWFFGDSTSDKDTSSLKDPVYIYPSSGKYQITLFAMKGNCKDSIRISLVIDKDIGTFLGPDRHICKGDSVLLGTENSGSFKYLWLPDSYLTHPDSGKTVAKPPVSIRYLVTRTTDVCVNVDQIDVFVSDPQAEFTSEFTEECKSAKLLIDSPGNIADTWWLLNGFLISYDNLLKERFPFRKSFILQMVAKDSSCYDTATKVLLPVPKDSMLNIPNVFTPGADEWNSCYSIKGLAFEKGCSHIWIYNRWGELMYDSDKHGNCWDGNVNGNPASVGVYYYVLEHHGQNYQGHIALIR